MYNIVLKALNKVINIKNNFISNDEDLLDYLNKLVLKKIIKKPKAKEEQSKRFFKRIKIIIDQI